MNVLKNFFRKGLVIGSFCLVSGTILSAQISLSMQNKSTREVIREIEKVSDYRFFYNDNLSGLDTRITISADEENIQNFTKCVLSELKLGSNSRASKEYRQKIAKVLIKRAFLQLKEDVYGN